MTDLSQAMTQLVSWTNTTCTNATLFPDRQWDKVPPRYTVGVVSSEATCQFAFTTDLFTEPLGCNATSRALSDGTSQSCCTSSASSLSNATGTWMNRTPSAGGPYCAFSRDGDDLNSAFQGCIQRAGGVALCVPGNATRAATLTSTGSGASSTSSGQPNAAVRSAQPRKQQHRHALAAGAVVAGVMLGSSLLA